MKIVVPYVRLHPVTRMVLSDYGAQVEYCRLDGDDGYRRLLQRLWREREDVLIVEHDIAPWPGALEELWSCMGLWCSCSYKMGGGFGISHMLGCVRLKGALMAKLPRLWDEPCRWDVLDQRLFFAARDVGQEAHLHRPHVLHLNAREYPNDVGVTP